MSDVAHQWRIDSPDKKGGSALYRPNGTAAILKYGGAGSRLWAILSGVDEWRLGGRGARRSGQAGYRATRFNAAPPVEVGGRAGARDGAHLELVT